MDRDEDEVINTKKGRGRYPAILTEQAWSIKDLLYGIKHQSIVCVLAEQSRIPSGQDIELNAFVSLLTL